MPPAPESTASPISNMTHQSGTSVTFNGPILTHLDYWKPIVYLEDHCQCCTFYGFGQMFNETHSSF